MLHLHQPSSDSSLLNTMICVVLLNDIEDQQLLPFY